MGRGLSRTRSNNGRLTNKLKRGVRSLSTLSQRTKQIRTRSQMEKEQDQNDNKDQTAKKAKQPTQQEQEDGGRTVHRNIVAQVRARSAMLRQRVMSRTKAVDQNNRLNSSQSYQDRQQVLDDDEDLASEPDEERVNQPDVLLRYKTAGKICDDVLKELLKNVAPGESVFRLCNLGDELIETKCGATFTKVKDATTGESIKKGISFPTNISVNNVLCNFRPLSQDVKSDVILHEGDVVKIHLGTHMDGYSAQAAHTVVCTAGFGQNAGSVDQDGNNNNNNNNSRGQTISREAANAVACAHYALTALIRGMRIGASGAELTDLLKSFSSNYGVEGCEGVLSNRTKRWILDGSQCIINRRVVRENPQQDVADTEIEPYQVWTLDVAFTTGQTFRMVPEEATIYRRNELPTPHDMRIRSAEALLHEIRDRFLCFPFCPTMSGAGTNHARLGVSQLCKAGVIDVVPPMRAKHGVVTARASCTIAITEKRIHIISGAPVLDAIAAQSAQPLPEILVDHTTAPLSFVTSNKKDGQEDNQEDDEASKAVAAAKSKKFVESSMANLGDAETKKFTKQQMSSLLPPGRKKVQVKDDADDASATQAREGAKPMKQRKVEQD